MEHLTVKITKQQLEAIERAAANMEAMLGNGEDEAEEDFSYCVNNIKAFLKLNIKPKPASPPSMPDEAFALKLNKFIHEQCIDGVPHDIGWNAMLMMRSQCDGLIKQKDEEIKKIKAESVSMIAMEKVVGMLLENSKRSYIAAGGTEDEWIEWYKKANKLNVN